MSFWTEEYQQGARSRRWVLLPKLSSGLVRQETSDFWEGEQDQRVDAPQANKQVIK